MTLWGRIISGTLWLLLLLLPLAAAAAAATAAAAAAAAGCCRCRCRCRCRWPGRAVTLRCAWPSQALLLCAQAARPSCSNMQRQGSRRRRDAPSGTLTLRLGSPSWMMIRW